MGACEVGSALAFGPPPSSQPGNSRLETMAEQARNRRKFADVGLNAELYVSPDKAHQVRAQEFDEWNDKVVKILDRAAKDIGVETQKFLQTHEGLGIQAPIEPPNWCQLRLDDNACLEFRVYAARSGV